MEKKSSPPIEDLLRIEGIKSKGYGTVPKAVMRDRDLSIFAKAIYAYFCSLSGKGDCVFPGRNKILSDLQISKDAYYKGLNELIENGYITVHQENTGGKGRGFRRNVYTITERPQKYANFAQADTCLSKLHEQIWFLGLDACGYGIIPYAVTSDSRLKSQPKAVYAYISSHAGNVGYTDLDTEIMRIDLGFKDPKSNWNYLKQLRQLNYVTVVQLHKNGRYAKTRYYINLTPDVCNAQCQRTFEIIHQKQSSVLQDTQKQSSVLQDAQEQSSVLQDTQEQSSVLQDTQEQSSVLQDTQEQSSVLQDTQEQSSVLQSSVSQSSVLQSSVLQDTTNNSNTINSITNNRNIIIDRLIDRVKKILRYELLELIYDDNPAYKPDLDLLVEAMVDVLGSTAPRITIGGEPLITDHVREVLLQRTTPDAAIKVLERFWTRAHKIDKKNHKQYLLTSIYRESLYPTATDDTDDPVDSIYSQG